MREIIMPARDPRMNQPWQANEIDKPPTKGDICTCTERGEDDDYTCDGESCIEPGATCSTFIKRDNRKRDNRMKRPL